MLSGLGDRVGIGIEAVDEEAVLRAKGRGEPAGAAADMDDQTAGQIGLGKDLLGRRRQRLIACDQRAVQIEYQDSNREGGDRGTGRNHGYSPSGAVMAASVWRMVWWATRSVCAVG